MSRVLFLVAVLLVFINAYSQTVLLPLSNGEIVKHTYYTLSYSEPHEQAEWVYYVLTPDNINGSVARHDKFRPDNKVPTGSAQLADYKKSGYDRGHLCPAAAMKQNSKAMLETFYMSNMSPQKPSFNRGGWKKLETYVRELTLSDKLLYVVTGPVLNGIDSIKSIGINEVTVPEYFYKVIYSPNKQYMKAYLMPNNTIKSALDSYIITVDKLEEITDIDFFYNLNDSIQNKLEAQ